MPDATSSHAASPIGKIVKARWYAITAYNLALLLVTYEAAAQTLGDSEKLVSTRHTNFHSAARRKWVAQLPVGPDGKRHRKTAATEAQAHAAT